MNLTIVTMFAYPHVGGVSSYIDTLRAEMTAQGHQVDVLSAESRGDWRWRADQLGAYALAPFSRPAAWRVMTQGGIDALGRALERRLASAGDGAGGGAATRAGAAARASAAGLAGAAGRAATAELLLNPQSAWGMAACLRAPKARALPKLLTLHGYAAQEASVYAHSERERRIRLEAMRHIEAEAYRGADVILAVDTRIAEYARDLVGNDVSIRVLLNRPDPLFTPALRQQRAEARERFGLPADSPVLACPRRLVPKNGVAHAIQALSLIAEKAPEAVLAIAGDGEERARLEELVNRRGLSGSVRFLGPLAKVDVAALYGAADLVLVPSVTYQGVQEASSLSALEAMAAGVPVIASAIGGLREIITSGETGLLVPEGEPEAIAAAALGLLADPAAAQALAERALAAVRARSQAWLDHYLDAVREATAHAQAR